MPTTRASRAPSLKYQNQQGRLINAAATLFNRQGIKGTTLSDVAASVGLTNTSATYYYRKKEDLAVACFQRMLAALDQRIERAMAGKTVEARIRSLFSQEVTLLAAIRRGEHPELISFNDIRSLPEQQAKVVGDEFVRLWRRGRDLLMLPELAHLDRNELNIRAYAVTAQLMRARAAVRAHEPDHYQWVSERLADILLNGLSTSRHALPMQSSSPCLLPDEPASPADAFVQAATELFNEQGFSGSSIDQMASSLKLTKGAFYHHLDNKDELIVQCVERSTTTHARAFDLAMRVETGAAQQMLAVLHALVCFQLSPRGPLLRNRAMVVQNTGQDLQVGRRHMLQRWSYLVVDGMRAGQVRAVDSATAAFTLEGLVDDAARAHRWAPRATTERLAKLWIHSVWLGIKA